MGSLDVIFETVPEERPAHDLYPRLLGEAWGRLPEVVRRCHAVMRAKASMRVTRGRSFFARLMGFIARFPKESPSCETAIVVLGREGPGRRLAGRAGAADLAGASAVDVLVLATP